jgi:hypothetical protein
MLPFFGASLEVEEDPLSLPPLLPNPLAEAQRRRERGAIGGRRWSIEIDDDERVVAAVGGEQRALAGQADAIDKAL